MKRINIQEGFVGLVYRNGNFKEVLTKGSYWINPFNEVFIYNKMNEFKSNTDLNILLQNEKLASMLDVVEVADYEIVLKFKDKNFEQILTPGKYVFWKNWANNSFQTIDLRSTEIKEDIDVSFLKNAAMYPYVIMAKIETNEKALMMLDGKFDRILSAGTYYFWKKAKAITLHRVDMRISSLEIAGQEILTKDKANLRLTFMAHYKVTDAKVAVMENSDYEKQLYTLLQLAIREFVGTLSLDELLENKEQLTKYVQNTVRAKAQKMGLELIDSGVRDIILPGDMKEIINQVLIAQKKAQASMISRREETAATRSLLNTAKLMENNTMLFKLKEMEYIEKIADRIGEITVSGSGNVVKQLNDIFAVKK